MLARVLTLRFDPVRDGFDDTALRDFLKDKEVLSIRDYFFIRHEVPYLAVLVTYSLPQLAAQPVADKPREQRDTSWRELMTEADLPVFNALRDWRTEQSKQDGVPPYVICTNRQFAEMVKARPRSLAGLANIDGFGKTKLEKYGSKILAILARPPEPPPQTSKGQSEPVSDESSE